MLTEITDTEFSKFIGCKVHKLSKKPFKSKSKINTVKGVVVHPQKDIPAFTFVEDDSYVACNICVMASESDVVQFQSSACSVAVCA